MPRQLFVVAKTKKKKVTHHHVARRLGVWRSIVTDQHVQLHYVTLAGEAVPKPYCFSAAADESLYLKELGLDDETTPLAAVICQASPFLEAWREEACDFRHWYLPETIIRAYTSLGVPELYPWQADCLHLCLGEQRPNDRVDASSRWSLPEPKSVLYSAPTSGGKSLVAEILMARAALLYGRRCLLVLPHVSLCAEKVTHLRRVFGHKSVGLRIEPFHSSEGSAATWHSGIDIAVCTIEKANAILNRLLLELTHERAVMTTASDAPMTTQPMATFNSIGIIVIDELHLVCDPQRMATLLNNTAPQPIQLVGLSATLPNLQEVAEWMNAVVYETTTRPVPLDLFVKYKHKVARIQGPNRTPMWDRQLPPTHLCRVDPHSMSRVTARDPDHLGYLVWERYRRRQQCLVFCATKEWCQTSCGFLTRILPFYDAPNLIFLQEDDKDANQQSILTLGAFVGDTSDPAISPLETTLRETDALARHDLHDALVQAATGTAACPTLLRGVLVGVGYHHAGMTNEERQLIEDAYRQGTMLVLCATSTLAVGVNLPVSRVIFRSTQIGRDDMDAGRFRQMAGRAGRKNFDVRGEAVVMCSSEKETSRVLAVLTGHVEPIVSALTGLRLARLILELVVLRLVTSLRDLRQTLMEESFLMFQVQKLAAAQGSVLARQRENAVFDDMMTCLDYLRGNAALTFVDASSHATTLAPPPTLPSIDPLNSLIVLSHFFTYDRDIIRHEYPTPYRSYRSLFEAAECGATATTTAEECCPFLPLYHTSTADGVLLPRDQLTAADAKTVLLYSTPLGGAIVETSLSVEEGIEVFASLYREHRLGINLTSELHLLALVAPITHVFEIPWGTYGHLVERLSSRSQAIARVFGITRRLIRHMARDTTLWGDCRSWHEKWLCQKLTARALSLYHHTQRHRQFFYALVLLDILHEVPFQTICERFAIRPGSLQALHTRSILSAGVLAAFCAKLEWRELGSAFRSLGEALKRSYCSEHQLAFQGLDLIQGRRAEALASAGLRSIEELATVSVDAIARALEPLYRVELGTTEDSQHTRLRQDRLRQDLACKISAAAKAFVDRQLQDVIDAS